MSSGEARAHEGGCLCGAVRYRLALQPTDKAESAYCHCKICQKSSGSPVMAWITVPLTSFSFTQGTPTYYQSSLFAERGFCSKCGTQLAFSYKKEVNSCKEIDVSVSSLDEPHTFPPQWHIWTRSKIPWFDTSDSLPRHETSGPDVLPAPVKETLSA